MPGAVIDNPGARGRRSSRGRASACIAVMLFAAHARAETITRAEPARALRRHAIVIGNNAAPPGHPELQILRYADDDAAAFSRFMIALGADLSVLTVLDAESERRYPTAARDARAPSLNALRAAVAGHAQRIRAENARGDDTEVWFFFSGHGTRDAAGVPFLALGDAALTQDLLYDEIIAPLGARYVHLFVDACHAEAVVRPRGEAQTVAVSPDEARAFGQRRSLERFAHVGAAIATSVLQQAHEWDDYAQGVFTHELLSALRGAADVNGDHLIEYSEVHAFLAAANREVADPRARLDVLVRAPAVNRRVPLVDLRGLQGTGLARARGLGHLSIEDERGARVVDANAEAEHVLTLALPRAGELHLYTSQGEASFSLAEAGGVFDLNALTRRPSPSARRGAVSSALARGLFKSPYGPVYYRGFVDSAGDLPVDFVEREAAPADVLAPRRHAAYGLWAAAGAAALAGGVLGVMTGVAADAYNRETLQAPAQQKLGRYRALGAAAAVSGAIAIAGAAAGFAIFPWLARHDVRVGVSSDGAGVFAAGRF